MSATATVRALLVLALAALLSGCIIVGADLEVSSDDTVSGELVTAFDMSAIQEMQDAFPGGEDELEDDFDADELEEDAQRFEAELADYPGASVEAIDDGERFGMRVVLDDVAFDDLDAIQGTLEELDADAGEELDDGLDDELAPPEGPDPMEPPSTVGPHISLARDGDEHVLTGEVDVFGDEAMMFPVEAEIDVVVTFAGEILEANGDVDGQTVTWSGEGPLEARAEADAGFGLPLPLLLAIGAAVLLLLLVGGGVALVLVLRR